MRRPARMFVASWAPSTVQVMNLITRPDVDQPDEVDDTIPMLVELSARLFRDHQVGRVLPSSYRVAVRTWRSAERPRGQVHAADDRRAARARIPSQYQRPPDQLLRTAGAGSGGDAIGGGVPDGLCARRAGPRAWAMTARPGDRMMSNDPFVGSLHGHEGLNAPGSPRGPDGSASPGGDTLASHRPSRLRTRGPTEHTDWSRRRPFRSWPCQVLRCRPGDCGQPALSSPDMSGCTSHRKKYEPAASAGTS